MHSNEKDDLDVFYLKEGLNEIEKIEDNDSEELPINEFTASIRAGQDTTSHIGAVSIARETQTMAQSLSDLTSHMRAVSAATQTSKIQPMIDSISSILNNNNFIFAEGLDFFDEFMINELENDDILQQDENELTKWFNSIIKQLRQSQNVIDVKKAKL